MSAEQEQAGGVDLDHDDLCERTETGRCFCWISRAEAERLTVRLEAADTRARLAEHRSVALVDELEQLRADAADWRRVTERAWERVLPYRLDDTEAMWERVRVEGATVVDREGNALGALMPAEASGGNEEPPETAWGFTVGPVEVRDSAGGSERVLADEDDDIDWGRFE